MYLLQVCLLLVCVHGGWWVRAARAEANHPNVRVAPERPTPVPEPKVANVTTAPSRLGPYELVAKDGSKVGLGFAGQLRGTLTNQGDERGVHLGQAGRRTEHSLDLRRIRLFLRGSFLDDRLRALVQFSLSPSSPELVDFWGEYAITSAARLRVGQQKLPFTRHRGQSFTLLPLTEWDIAAVAFGAERQIGIQLHDGMRGDGHINYALGAFSGVNARTAFARGMAETYGEPLVSRSSLRAAPPVTEVHPELVAMLGASTRGMDPVAVTDLEGGGLRAFAGVSASWDVRPERGQDFLGRVAPELLLKFRHLSCNWVAFGSLFEGGNGKAQPGLLGVTFEATYRFDAHFEVAARYSRVDSSGHLRSDARAHARGQLAAAGDLLGELQEQYADAGQVRSRDELGVGFNVYIVGRSLAWQSDVALLRLRHTASAEQPDEDLLRARSQLQLAF
jgi:hypothetical protein